MKTIPQLDATGRAAMYRAGQAAAGTLDAVGRRLRPGITTADIDRWVRRDTARRGGRPAQLGYHGFPAAVCTSVNEVVCHGIPSPRRCLQPGDLVNVDVTTELGGYHGDTSRTFLVGRASAEARHVVAVADRCLAAGIAAVGPGAQLGDIGHAIQTLARREGCAVVDVIGGHGIGRAMHQPPFVCHVGRQGTGLVLRPGMAITIEPMINLGTADTLTLADGWTVVTADGRLSAQAEHTLIVVDDGVVVTTARQRRR